ncbi:efflux RND transporter permease subunit [Bacteroidota bacterium]
MSITQFAIEKNRVTIMSLLIIIFGGLIAFFTLPQDEDPGFIIRTALVITYFPGASPERIEQLITDKIEKSVQEIPELDNVMSQSRTGVSEIYVNIKERYRNMRPIWDNLRRKVDKVKSNLPDGIIGPIVNDEFGDVFGVVITVTGEGYTYSELKNVADEVRDEFLQLPDIAKVDIYGAQEERVFVEYNNAILSELGFSPIQLKSILEGKNIINPGGEVRLENQRIVLEPLGNFESIDELRRTLVNIPRTGEIVPLEDIADIYRDYIDPPRSLMRTAGSPCLGLGISMRDGGNIIEMGNQVTQLYEHLKTIYPIGIEFDIVAFQPDHVSKKVNDFTSSLIQAIILVLLVMLVTLGIRTGVVVATLVPMAMLLSLMIMSFIGIQIDQMSLASLMIALGLLVDNAIVMSESVMVQMTEGKEPVQAAVDSAKELRIPLLTSSLTTAAAFLPIFLAHSAVGEYTAPLFKVVTITLLSSWILALTMTPLLCSKFIKVKTKKSGSYDSKFYSIYRNFLIFLLKRKALTMISVFVLFVLTMMAAGFIPGMFFPPNDKAIFTAEIELPYGTAIERTNEVIKDIEKYIVNELKVNEERLEGVTNWMAFIGSGYPRFYLSANVKQPSPGYSAFVLNCTSRAIVDEMIPKLEKYCFNNFPEAITKIFPLQLGPPVKDPVEVRVYGKDINTLFGLVNKIKVQLGKIEGTKNIQDNWGVRTQKLLVRIDDTRAKMSDLTNQDIAVSLQTLLSGFKTTEYREGDKVIPVIMRSVAEERENIDRIEGLNIYSMSTGKSVPLKQVADIELVWENSQIMRRNRYKSITISSSIFSGYNAAQVTAELEKWLGVEKETWPIGYTYEYGGENEASEEANKSIMAQLPIAGLLIILLLVIQFNSFRKPAIILITIPLGLIGVVIGLLIFQSYFGFMTLLGVISLSGIVINNAIVLLERIQLEIDENGLTPQRAVVEAAQRRLRPILLTTATTIGGLIPLYLGGGPMWEPMAIAIMVGLLFATLLTLGVIPVLYSSFFKVKYKGFIYD